MEQITETDQPNTEISVAERMAAEALIVDVDGYEGPTTFC